MPSRSRRGGFARWVPGPCSPSHSIRKSCRASCRASGTPHVANNAFAARLAELQAAFRSQLPARLADMQRLAAGGPAEIAELRAMAHKLAGQGGTFGAAAVGAAAAE